MVRASRAVKDCLGSRKAYQVALTTILNKQKENVRLSKAADGGTAGLRQPEEGALDVVRRPVRAAPRRADKLNQAAGECHPRQNDEPRPGGGYG